MQLQFDDSSLFNCNWSAVNPSPITFTSWSSKITTVVYLSHFANVVNTSDNPEFSTQYLLLLKQTINKELHILNKNICLNKW